MKFSIITVNYNNYTGLYRTIESILSQSYKNFEFIIIDGGSTDGSKELLEKYDAHIDYWVSEPDKGIYNGMNKGIARAHGEYLNFMNSGDTFFKSTTLEEINNMIDGSDFIVGCDYNEDSTTGMSATTILPTRVSFATFFMQTLPHQSTFIRQSKFNNNLYDEHLKIVADWKFFMDKIVYDDSSVQFIDLIICKREQGGISNSQFTKVNEERELILSLLLPPGIRKDYDSLSKLDRSTVYKLLNLCDDSKAVVILNFVIKVLYRLFRRTIFGTNL